MNKKIKNIILVLVSVSIIFCMFVVQVESNGVFTTNKGRPNKQGEANGCKFRVNSMHRMDFACRDLPSLFNFNHFIMQAKNDSGTTCANALTPERIINELLEHDSPENIMENFHDVMLAFISYNEVIPREEMIEIIFSYRAVRDMLKKIKKLFN